MPRGTLHWPKLTNPCEHSPVHPDSLVSQEAGPVRIETLFWAGAMGRIQSP